MVEITCPLLFKIVLHSCIGNCWKTWGYHSGIAGTFYDVILISTSSRQIGLPIFVSSPQWDKVKCIVSYFSSASLDYSMEMPLVVRGCLKAHLMCFPCLRDHSLRLSAVHCFIDFVWLLLVSRDGTVLPALNPCLAELEVPDFWHGNNWDAHWFFIAKVISSVWLTLFRSPLPFLHPMSLPLHINTFCRSNYCQLGGF